MPPVKAQAPDVPLPATDVALSPRRWKFFPTPKAPVCAGSLGIGSNEWDYLTPNNSRQDLKACRLSVGTRRGKLAQGGLGWRVR